MKNPDQMLGKLNSEQKDAVSRLRGPLLITAGAGTGKTTTIAHRIAYGIAIGAYNPSKILALSYTARAAAELRDRLHELGAGSVTVRTFHAAALAQLQYFWPVHTGAKLPTLEPNKSRVLGEVAKNLGYKLDERQLRDLIAEIEWRKYRLVSLDDYRLASNRPIIDGLARESCLELIEGYEQRKIAHSIIDWEDVLLLILGLLQAEPAALSHVHSQYQQFFVDEFQDISPLQWELLQLWLGRSKDLCAVGDPRQAIFGFAGADPLILNELDARFDSLARAELTINYRSTAQILKFASQVDPESNLVPPNSKRQKPGQHRFASFSSAGAEASWVVDQVTALISAGRTPSEIAVLARVGSSLSASYDALIASGIPAVFKSSPYFQQPKVAEAVALIRALKVSTAVESPFVEVTRILRQLGWRPDRPRVFDEGWERLNWIHDRLNHLSEAATISDFIADLEDLQRGQYEPKLAAVQLTSIHAAKGLEWQSVFLIQASDGMLPYQRAIGDTELLAEERRLLYVAVTRAKLDLFITFSNPDSFGRSASKSRFLQLVEFEVVQ